MTVNCSECDEYGVLSLCVYDEEGIVMSAEIELDSGYNEYTAEYGDLSYFSYCKKNDLSSLIQLYFNDHNIDEDMEQFFVEECGLNL